MFARRFVVGALSFVFPIMLGACAGGSIGDPTPPKVEGTTWIEVETPHFLLQTDLPEPKARELIDEFHRRAHALSWALLEQETLPDFHSRIIVFERDKDFEYFAPDVAGAFAASSLAYEAGDVATLVQSGDASRASFSKFQHELTHRILFEAFGDTPPWLSEGMATYYGALSEKDGVLRMGEQPARWVFSHGGTWKGQNRASHWEIEVPIAQLIPPSRLMATGGKEFYPKVARPEQRQEAARTATLHYASSWVLVHMLLNGPESYRARFARILSDVAAGGAARNAVEAHLGEIPAEEFERDFFAHVQAQQRNVWQTDLPGSLPSPSTKVRPMVPAEVALLWAKLARTDGEPRPAQTWIAEATAADPDHPEVLFVAAMVDLERGDLEAARDKLEQAHTRSPEDPAPLVVLTHLFLGEPGAGKARQAKLVQYTNRLLPLATQAHELQAAALGLAATGRLDPAESTPKQAIQANPNCWSCFDSLARIRFARGDSQSAAQLQEIAISRAWEGASFEQRQRLQSRLSEYSSAPASGENSVTPLDEGDAASVQTSSP